MIKTILKIFFIGLLIFISLGYLIGLFLVKPLSQDIIKNNQLVAQTNIKLFETKIQKPLLDLQYATIQNTTNDFITNNNITNISFRLVDYFVSVDALLENSSNVKEKDWVLSDIAIDSKFGILVKITDTVYRFENDNNFKFNIPIKIKFQARNENNMENSISTINFVLPEFYITEKKEDTFGKSYIQSFFGLDPINYEKTFFLSNGIAFATMKLTYHQNDSITSIYHLIYNFGMLYILVFTTLFILYFVISYLYTKSLILNHLNQLETYIIDIKENNFFKYDAKQF